MFYCFSNSKLDKFVIFSFFTESLVRDVWSKLQNLQKMKTKCLKYTSNRYSPKEGRVRKINSVFLDWVVRRKSLKNRILTEKDIQVIVLFKCIHFSHVGLEHLKVFTITISHMTQLWTFASRQFLTYFPILIFIFLTYNSSMIFSLLNDLNMKDLLSIKWNMFWS